MGTTFSGVVVLIVSQQTIVNFIASQFGVDISSEIRWFIIIFLMCFLIASYYIGYRIFRDWHGEVSVIQHERQQEKIPDTPKYLVLDSLELMRDWIRWAW